MRYKWPSVSPCRDGHQDRRIHFDETPTVQEPANSTNNPAPLHKGVRDFRIRDQVQVPLPVTGLHVPEPVPLFRQGTHPFSQHGQRLRLYRRLPRPRSHHVAGHAQEIPQIKILQRLVFVAQYVLPQHGLHHAGCVPKVEEGRAPHHAHGNYPSGQAEVFDCIRRVARFRRLELLDGLGRRATAFKPRRIRIHASLAHTVQFGPSALEVSLKAPQVFRILGIGR